MENVTPSVNRVWLESYPDGVPADINPDRYASINDIFDQACRQFANLPAFTCMGKTHTYAELDRLAMTFARALNCVNLLRAKCFGPIARMPR